MIIAIFLLQAVVQANDTKARWAYFKPIVETISQGKATLAISPTRGIGMIALKNLRAGEVIMTVSLTNMLTCKDSFPFAAAFHDLDCYYRLLARVMYDRWVNPSPGLPADFSRYHTEQQDVYPLWDQTSKNYMAKAFPTMNYTILLNYDEVKPVFLRRIRGIQRIEQICRECVTEEAFNWAFGLVMSRSRSAGEIETLHTGLEMKPGDLTFNPIMDFANHRPLPRNTRIPKYPHRGEVIIGNPNTDVSAHIQLFTDYPISQGSEIYIQYADLSTMRLWLRYSFVQQYNPGDYMAIAIEEDWQCPDLYNDMTRLCIYRMYPGLFSQTLMLYLRRSVRENLPPPAQGYNLIPGSFFHFYATRPDTSDEEESKWTLLYASFRYRSVVMNQSFTRCQLSYRLTVRALAKGNYQSERQRQVDELCAAAWETQFAVLQPIDRFLIYALLSDSGLRHRN